jgi:hypothetical protein
MPRRLTALSLLSFLGFVSPAFAVDPFTVIAAGGAAVNTVQSIAGASQEAAEIASSLSVLSELIAEIDSDAGEEGDGGIAERLREIERVAFEVGYTQDELADILAEPRDSSRQLSTTLAKITRSVRLTKRLAALAGISTKKAAEVSQIEQSRSQNDEKKILSQIHSQMVRTELNRKLVELKKEKKVTEEVRKLHSFLAGLAPAGNLRLFPASSAIVRKAIEVFESYSRYLLLIVGLIFAGRLLYYEFSFAPAEKYGDLIRDAFVCFFLMIVFPKVYGYMAEYSDALAVKLGQALDVVGAYRPETRLLFGQVVPWWLDPSVIQAGAYLVVYSLFNLVLAILIALGPLFILAGTMLNFSVSLPAYFAALVFIWSWPVVWNMTGYFMSLLWKGRDWSASGLAEVVVAAALGIVQFLSPFVLYKHLSSGQIGQAIRGGIGNATALSGRAQAAAAASKVVAAKASGGATLLASGASKAAGATKALVPGRRQEPRIQLGNERFAQ